LGDKFKLHPIQNHSIFGEATDSKVKIFTGTQYLFEGSHPNEVAL
jgi:hypothetical protein